MSRGRQTLAGRYHPQIPLRSEWLQNGFVNRDDTITFTNGSETFEIAPSGSYFDFYVEGHRHRSDGDTIVLDGTDGQHWIYYDNTGTIQELVNPSHAQLEDAIENQCLIAMVYWNNNTSEGYLFDERHGMSMSPASHRIIHECIGMLWADGVAIDGIETDESGASNSHAQFGNTSGEVYDEDVAHDIGANADPATYECWWWDGTRWQWDTNAGYPFLVGATPRLQYNTGGALVEVGNGEFALVHLFATSAEDGNPIIIVGQSNYSNIAAAREGAATEISALVLGTLPSPELKPMATVIFQSSNGYGNDMKTRARTASGGHDYTDWRMNPVSPGGGTVTDHGSLGGLPDDDHSGHPWLLGRSGGQTLYGGIDAGDDLTLYSTSHATKGNIDIGGVLHVDEVNSRVGIGDSTPAFDFHVKTSALIACAFERSGGQPRYRLWRSDAHAANALIGQHDFTGQNTTPAPHLYATILARSIDNTAGSEDGQIQFNTRLNGVLTLSHSSYRGILYCATQVGVGTNAPATSALLDLTSTTGALLVPRMTQAQRLALTAVDGMIVYDTTNTAFYFYENAAWVTGSGLA